MHFIAAWREERRWKTVHKLHKELVVDPSWAFETFKDTKYTRPDIVTALHLAWQIYMQDEVYKYEIEMKEKNGAI